MRDDNNHMENVVNNPNFVGLVMAIRGGIASPIIFTFMILIGWPINIPIMAYFFAIILCIAITSYGVIYNLRALKVLTESISKDFPDKFNYSLWGKIWPKVFDITYWPVRPN